MPSERDRVLKYGEDKYHAQPTHPWNNFPNYTVLRNAESDKWFALIMDVPRAKIGLGGDDIVDILDIKCDPNEVGDLRKKEGYLRAYHMNKEHWVTILLDGTVPLQDITHLMDKSYELTR